MASFTDNNLIKRTISGLILAVVVLGCIILSQYTFLALLLAVCAGCMKEFYDIAAGTGVRPLKIYGVFAGMAFVLLTYLTVAEHFNESTRFLTVIVSIPLFIFIAFAAELFRRSDNPIGNMAATLMGIIYISLPLSLFCYIAIGSDAVYNPEIILLYIFIVWANDVGAYLVGISIGKHRLMERISPKKSWEGFFGGVIAACAAGAGAAVILDQSLTFWIVLGLITSLSGVLGDLVESMMKRSVGVKDSGKIMPGHGGFLDRFDALIFSLPFVFVYFIIFAN